MTDTIWTESKEIAIKRVAEAMDIYSEVKEALEMNRPPNGIINLIDLHLKSYSQNILTHQKQQFIEVVGDNEVIGLPVTQEQEQKCYEKKIRNKFRTEILKNIE